MSAKKKAKTRYLNISGMIGETSDFFRVPLKNVTELNINMRGVTYMNSVGVKEWIMWTSQVPESCIVRLFECPYLIVSQAASVFKFLPKNFVVESFYAPFLCEECEDEELHKLVKDVNYGYKTDKEKEWLKIPTDLLCPKCADKKLYPDFVPTKIFKFLLSASAATPPTAE
jgi:hypothetical protein